MPREGGENEKSEQTGVSQVNLIISFSRDFNWISGSQPDFNRILTGYWLDYTESGLKSSAWPPSLLTTFTQCWVLSRNQHCKPSSGKCCQEPFMDVGANNRERPHQKSLKTVTSLKKAFISLFPKRQSYLGTMNSNVPNAMIARLK